jgi:hypothetical protein
LLKRVNMHLRNVSDLVSTCLVLHNIYIIFGNDFWKSEWMQKATDEVLNGMTTNKVLGTSTRERLAVANHVLHSLTGIDKSNMKSL